MNEPFVKPLKVLLDDRGYLSEILRCDDPCYTKFGQLYLSTTTPGTIKGFHRHHKKTDYLTCVSGQVKLAVINDDGKTWEFHLSPMAPKLVVIPPGLWHGWLGIPPVPAILISVTTEPYLDTDKDEERMDPVANRFGYIWGVKNG